MMRREPHSPLFPYTTLFRSDSTRRTGNSAAVCDEPMPPFDNMIWSGAAKPSRASPFSSRPRRFRGAAPDHVVRSEEHTSELQSHSDLVCRLLLEKKNHTRHL